MHGWGWGCQVQKKKQTEKEILYLEWANRFRKHTTHTFISFLFRSSYSPIKLNDFLFGLILTPFENIYEKKNKCIEWNHWVKCWPELRRKRHKSIWNVLFHEYAKNTPSNRLNCIRLFNLFRVFLLSLSFSFRSSSSGCWGGYGGACSYTHRCWFHLSHGLSDFIHAMHGVYIYIVNCVNKRHTNCATV